MSTPFGYGNDEKNAIAEAVEEFIKVRVAAQVPMSEIVNEVMEATGYGMKSALYDVFVQPSVGGTSAG